MKNNEKAIIVGIVGLGVIALVLTGKKTPAEPPVENGTLNLSFSPAEAVVTLGGTTRAAGQIVLSPGTYDWSATAAGYQPQSGTVTITAGQTTSLIITLIASVSGSFTLQAINPPEGVVTWAAAFLDPVSGIYYQRADLRIPPPPGNCTLPFTATAPYTVPVTEGILSIGAYGPVIGEIGQNNLPPELLNLSINISVSDGGIYTFDFDTRTLS